MSNRYNLLVIIVLFGFGCADSYSNTDNAPSGDIILTILYTGDEHGWMEEDAGNGGAAGLLNTWIEEEQYTPDGPFLILSGGDMWTGPAISTWFKGESMQEVMNAMDYDAAAIGNHEFDFGISELHERLSESDFPFLAANIREISTGQIPEFAQPYHLVQVADITVGIIGLSNISTPTTTAPENVAELEFLSYSETLSALVPEVKSAGAELMIVIGHLCEQEMRTLAPIAFNLGVSLIGGGHCHQLTAIKTFGVGVIAGGSGMSSYARAQLAWSYEENAVVDIDVSTHTNLNAAENPEIADIVSVWRGAMDDALNIEIGYVADDIRQQSAEMHNMITDSWLVSFPMADIAVSNTGGIRQAIPAGPISIETIVGVLPFDNSIYEMELNGAQVLACIGSNAIGGLSLVGEAHLLDGTPLHPDSTYSTLTNSYLYSVSSCFQNSEPNPYDTSVHYRQPLIDWLQEIETTPENPLDEYLDSTARHP